MSSPACPGVDVPAHLRGGNRPALLPPVLGAGVPWDWEPGRPVHMQVGGGCEGWAPQSSEPTGSQTHTCPSATNRPSGQPFWGQLPSEACTGGGQLRARTDSGERITVERAMHGAWGGGWGLCNPPRSHLVQASWSSSSLVVRGGGLGVGDGGGALPAPPLLWSGSSGLPRGSLGGLAWSWGGPGWRQG